MQFTANITIKSNNQSNLRLIENTIGIDADEFANTDGIQNEANILI